MPIPDRVVDQTFAPLSEEEKRQFGGPRNAPKRRTVSKPSGSHHSAALAQKKTSMARASSNIHAHDERLLHNNSSQRQTLGRPESNASLYDPTDMI